MLLGDKQRQQPSVSEHPQCSDRRSDKFMRCLRDVLWEALGPAAATPEHLPDLPPSLQGMDSPLDIRSTVRVVRSIIQAEMDRSSELWLSTRHGPERARIPRDVPRTSKPSRCNTRRKWKRHW